MGTVIERRTHKLQGLPGELDSLFARLAVSNAQIAMASQRVWHPPTDVYETPEAIVVKMDIGGVTAEDITITFEDGAILVSGHRRDDSKQRCTTYHQMEIVYGVFERRIIVNRPVDREAITARYDNGFLEIAMPKVERPVSRTVSIKVTL